MSKEANCVRPECNRKDAVIFSGNYYCCVLCFSGKKIHTVQCNERQKGKVQK